ncbi:SCO family protein [Brevibacillus parabrevis]|uniref:Lipoprotein n=1 Tax=Brevibacillus parabrevis TaxID=54914 RepID=A0A4Y3PN39_BREPA|nr:SCO family protein [Brevibacillus parabrevis]MED2258130.1 SCO family protein [Brevibacillus parabrevis]RNB95892.1 SCO family protein [Brevibacillus parabrevis]WDV94809.1 SCO family protein [Brevibacillus parabrevis]GEB33406.1 lipoprotein [Brevibacillus parabrevis]
MKRAVWFITLVITIVLATACGSEKASKLNIPVQPFAFTDQDGKPFSSADVENKVWVANFIFTYCATVCPTMTANMAQLQKKAKEAGVDVELVSFSVDPEQDSPEALKAYLGKFAADFSNWHALTGYEFAEIKTFLLRSFRATIAKDAASEQVIHDTLFYLVDQNGKVVARYDGMTDPPYDEIVEDIKLLQK